MARKDADKGAKARKAEKMAAALEYKKLGATERFIADKLEISPATAHRYITQGMAEVRERGLQNAEAMVAMESERLDRARFAIAAQMVAGNLDAVREWRGLSESYRKLHGLDKPTSVALTDPSGQQMWQTCDPKVLAELLTPGQLAVVEEVMSILENAGTVKKGQGADAEDE